MEGFAAVTHAIAYIEHNLSQKLDLQAVAESAHYSKYHLHRTFTRVVGMVESIFFINLTILLLA